MGLRRWRPRASGSPTRWAARPSSLREIIDNCRAITDATDLPVNADLENCGADEPKAASQAIRLAAEAGVVGGSIEDKTTDNPKSDL